MSTGHLIADIPCKAFIEQDGKVLFVLEVDNKWSLPGGRMNVGESIPQESLKREIKEELGVDIEVGAPIGCSVFTSKSGVNHFVVAFSSKITLGQEIILDPKEIIKIEWLDIHDVLNRTMHEGSRLIIERLVAAS